MLITFNEFRDRLKSLGQPVFRDRASNDTGYPYWVYTYTNTARVVASGVGTQAVNEYQVSLFTKGTESDLGPFMAKFKDVPFQNFRGIPGDENDHTITNLYTYIQVIPDGK